MINFVFYFVLSVTSATLLTDCTTSLYSAWHKAKMKLEDESWLRENCKDPLFFSKMKSHTNLCSEVEANARIGAFWTALHDVIESLKHAWYPWMIGWTGYLFLFIILFYWIMSMCVFRGIISKRKMKSQLHLDV